MDNENLKDIYRNIIDAIGRGDADALDELMAPDIVDHNPVPDQAPGVQGFKQWMAYARSSFPDLSGTVEDIIAEGDRVAGRVTWRGTQEGAFLGIPAERQTGVLPRLPSRSVRGRSSSRVVGYRRSAERYPTARGHRLGPGLICANLRTQPRIPDLIGTRLPGHPGDRLG
ncbi:MAG TPA: ester cyclase [Actinomycetota bacterium]|nr:ester cyclase [Actinomycetota bacterium]